MATAVRTRPRSNQKPARAHRRKQASRSELRDLRHRCGLPQALLARLLDVSLRTLSGAESAAATVPPQMRRSVTQVVRLCETLGEAMQPAFIGQWLDQP